MRHILSIEDSPSDQARIKDLLLSDAYFHDTKLVFSSSLEQGRQILTRSSIHFDLVLLDLEFREEKVSSLYFLDTYSFTPPIVILSFLTHYQKFVSMNPHVKGFVSKNQLEQLIPSIKYALGLSPLSQKSSRAIFPSDFRHGISESIPVQKILFIERISRKEYNVHRTDGTSQTVRTVSASELALSFRKQDIFELKRSSAGEILNSAYIKQISKNRSGRYEVLLIGQENHPFIISNKYIKDFTQFINE